MPARPPGPHIFTILLAALLALPVAAQTVSAQIDTAQVDTATFQPRVLPVAEIGRTSGTIKVDGELDEPAWSAATLLSGFAEVQPGNQVEPPVRSEALVTYDEQNLYVAFRAYDDPSSIRATFRNRDEIFQDDWVGIILDTYGDAGQAYEIFANPLGIQGDLFMSAGGNEDVGFDLIYYSEGRITEFGYQVEMAIPFGSLRFPNTTVQTWRITFLRNHPRDARRLYSWASADLGDPCILCQLGTLTGIEGVKPGTKLSLIPAFVGSHSGALADEDDPGAGLDNERITPEVSLNVRYNLTSSLAAEATINPDFSQIESDAARIDVNSTFALFFPERRPFFQEGSDLFSTWLDVVYTRSINNPIGALKWTGRAGRTSIAILNALDQDTPVLLPFEEQSNLVRAGRSFSNIVRARHTFGASSFLGATVTDRRLVDGGGGSIASTDLKVQFLKNYRLEAQVAVSRTTEPNSPTLSEQVDVETFARGRHTAALDGESFLGHGVFLSFDRNSRLWNFDVGYSAQSPTFRTANGFVRQNDFHAIRMFQGLNIYPENSFFVTISPGFFMRRQLNFDGAFKEGEIQPMLNLQMRGQTNVHMSYGFNRERFRADLFEGLRSWTISVNSRFSDPLGGGFYISGGRRIARFQSPPEIGRGLETGAFLTIKPLQRLVINPSIDFASLQDLETSEEFFSGFILRTSVDVQLTRALSVRLITQYDDFDDRLDLEPLLTFQLNPFSVFYVGSTHDYGRLGTNSFVPVERQIFFKFQYLIRR